MARRSRGSAGKNRQSESGRKQNERVNRGSSFSDSVSNWPILASSFDLVH
jgi:hypothetical protein